jgi:hypothetical protein
MREISFAANNKFSTEVVEAGGRYPQNQEVEVEEIHLETLA